MKYLKLKWTLTAAVLLAGAAVASACLTTRTTTCTYVNEVIYVGPLVPGCGVPEIILTVSGETYKTTTKSVKCGGGSTAVPNVSYTVLPVFETHNWTWGIGGPCLSASGYAGYALVPCSGTQAGGNGCPCPAALNQ